MENIKMIIDGRTVLTSPEKTILEVCKENGINIPTLCEFEGLQKDGNCRICSVEVKGRDTLVTTCNTKAQDLLEIKTNSKRVTDARKTILKLMMANHPNDCLSCERAKGDCELQNLCYEYGVNRDEIPYSQNDKNINLDLSTNSIVRDMNKCILCKRCIKTCEDIQGIGIYELEGRGIESQVKVKGGIDLSQSNCINCGQCIKACPVGALYEKNSIRYLEDQLNNPQKHLIVQVAPAIKNTLGEEFFMEPGQDVTGKVVSSLKKLGFDKVFNTDFSADVTIMEEGHEFLERFKSGQNLPLFTSCSPGWVNYMEKNYPELIPNISSCKSPQQMFGALSKSYYAEKSKINPNDIISVSIMPCTAKKEEANRIEMQNEEGIKDVDIVLTTRELAKLIKLKRIDFESLEDQDFDDFLGEGSGAARIFASTGGVMEAALRSVVYTLTNGKMDSLDYYAVRGLENAKEATLEIDGIKVSVAVVHGTKAAKQLIEKIKLGEKTYHFVEVMGCIGGCIGGGGAPMPDNMQIKELRSKGIYKSDSLNQLRRSHENKEVIKLYSTYLGKPGGHKAHHLLHTSYTNRKK